MFVVCFPLNSFSPSPSILLTSFISPSLSPGKAVNNVTSCLRKAEIPGILEETLHSLPCSPSYCLEAILEDRLSSMHTHRKNTCINTSLCRSLLFLIRYNIRSLNTYVGGHSCHLCQKSAHITHRSVNTLTCIHTRLSVTKTHV